MMPATMAPNSRDLAQYLDCLGFREGEYQLMPPKRKKLEPKAPLPKLELGWEELKSKALGCQNCKLSPTRTQVVFGSGDPKARLMFVGEGPGAEEDKQGIPFVGRSGQLLTKMIEAMGLSRDKVFIANVVKCRPPQNRNPEPDEIHECSPYLLRQVELISPEVIVALGTFAAQTLLQTDEPIGQLRGRFHTAPNLKNKNGKTISLIPTFHPAFCLRNPAMKKPVWEDLQLVMKELGIEAPTPNSQVTATEKNTIEANP